MSGFRFGTGFEVDGERCDAWLWVPVDADDPPTVVMAHGFACPRHWRLPAFARRFAGEGLAVLLFDHRGFGDSEGEPGVLAPARQRDDWRAAIDHARAHGRTGDRVAAWGTSFSAGRALVAAAEGRVDALALQVPYLDGRAQTWLRVRQEGVGWLLWALRRGLVDRLRALLRRSPGYVPVAGDPGERAILTSPSARPGYDLLVPDGEDRENRVAARVLLSVPFDRPVARASEVDCPTLVVQAADDDVVPTGPVDALVDALDDVERVRYDAGHFAPYAELFERVADRQAAFLARYVIEDP